MATTLVKNDNQVRHVDDHDPLACLGTGVQLRVDSGRGQDRTLRGVMPVECAIDGWS